MSKDEDCKKLSKVILDRYFEKHKDVFEQVNKAIVLGQEVPKVKVYWDEKTQDIKVELVE